MNESVARITIREQRLSALRGSGERCQAALDLVVETCDAEMKKGRSMEQILGSVEEPDQVLYRLVRYGETILSHFSTEFSLSSLLRDGLLQDESLQSIESAFGRAHEEWANSFLAYIYLSPGLRRYILKRRGRIDNDIIGSVALFEVAKSQGNVDDSLEDFLRGRIADEMRTSFGLRKDAESTTSEPSYVKKYNTVLKNLEDIDL